MTGAIEPYGSPGSPSRRSVLRASALLPYAALGGLTATLGACGIRMDTPPPPPPVPTRRKVTDEDVLIAVVRDTRAVHDAAKRASSSAKGETKTLVGAITTICATQDKTLTGRLTNQGVPTSVINGPAAAATATGTPSGAPTATSGSVSLDTALTHVPDDLWTRLASASEGTRGLAWAAYSVRCAAAELIDAPPPIPAASPARPALAARTEALVYGLEVAAAHVPAAERQPVLSTLTDLRDLVIALGEPPQSPGWSLPFEVTDAEAARKLITQVLASAAGTGVSIAGAKPTGPSLHDAAVWSGRVQAAAVPWGTALTAFPGAKA